MRLNHLICTAVTALTVLWSAPAVADMPDEELSTEQEETTPAGYDEMIEELDGEDEPPMPFAPWVMFVQLYPGALGAVAGTIAGLAGALVFAGPAAWLDVPALAYPGIVPFALGPPLGAALGVNLSGQWLGNHSNFLSTILGAYLGALPFAIGYTVDYFRSDAGATWDFHDYMQAWGFTTAGALLVSVVGYHVGELRTQTSHTTQSFHLLPTYDVHRSQAGAMVQWKMQY